MVTCEGSNGFMSARLGRCPMDGWCPTELVGLPALPTTGLKGGVISLSIASLFRDVREAAAVPTLFFSEILRPSLKLGTKVELVAEHLNVKRAHRKLR